MAKASVIKNYKVSATGILSIDKENGIAVEIEETGELRPLSEILEDFKDRSVKITCTYDEDF